MRRARIEKRRRPGGTDRITDDTRTLHDLHDLLDPRDPDIVRAKAFAGRRRWVLPPVENQAQRGGSPAR
jgi:hypothetical protein